MQFNHVANRINPEHAGTVTELFIQQLGFVELRRTGRAVWLRQPGANVDLQLSHSDPGRRDVDRARSQVSFLSETPEADLRRLAAWFAGRGLAASVGSYSDREFFLDVPAAFVDFVIEAMRPELAVYDPAATLRAGAQASDGRTDGLDDGPHTATRSQAVADQPAWPRRRAVPWPLLLTAALACLAPAPVRAGTEGCGPEWRVDLRS